ncbi:hypothetical protein BURC_01072 [Burkholderiaceae bacterium]|nr:hypothetical protein BURC_01072 [Burkholderiaceae bacterium]
MRELFIYYRIEVAGAASALAAAQAFQQRLRDRHPGLTARLLRRPDDPTAHANDTQTWMEIYSFDDAGICAALQADIESEAAALATFMRGTRHTEVFVPCAS